MAQAQSQLDEQRSFFGERIAELEVRLRQTNTEQTSRSTENHTWFATELEAARERLAKVRCVWS